MVLLWMKDLYKRIKDSLEKGEPRPDYSAISGAYTHIFHDTPNGLIHDLEKMG